MELQPSLFLLLLILGTSLGASLTWFLCHNSHQATRIRHRERTKALLKSSAELEACCAKLEAQVQKLRSSEAQSSPSEPSACAVTCGKFRTLWYPEGSGVPLLPPIDRPCTFAPRQTKNFPTLLRISTVPEEFYEISRREKEYCSQSQCRFHRK